jgi:hypothetical protein
MYPADLAAAGSVTRLLHATGIGLPLDLCVGTPAKNGA